jgi:hypothetical protein
MRKISAGLFIFLNGVVEFPERWGFKYLSRDMSELIVAGIAREMPCSSAQRPTGFLRGCGRIKRTMSRWQSS